MKVEKNFLDFLFPKRIYFSHKKCINYKEIIYHYKKVNIN